MKIEKYGITLERIQKEDIELVRRFRNSPEIRKHMHFRDYITKKMQLRWFQGINNEFNYYFIIRYDGKRIGMINMKNINWIENISESGLFIWDPAYVNTHIPMMVAIMLGEFGFGVLKGKQNFIRILTDNKQAIDFNTSLGFEPVGPPDHNNLTFYLQTKESFLKKTAKFRKAILKLSGNDDHFYVRFNPVYDSDIFPTFFRYMGIVKTVYETTKDKDGDVYSFLPDFGALQSS